MLNKVRTLVILVGVFTASDISGHVVEPGCNSEDKICRFFLTIDYTYTMIYPASERLWIPVTAEADGLRFKSAENCSRGGPLLSDEGRTWLRQHTFRAWYVYTHTHAYIYIYIYIYIWSKVNIWNVNCARATSFIFDTRTGVLGKVYISNRRYYMVIY